MIQGKQNLVWMESDMRGLRSFHLLFMLALGILVLSLVRPVVEKEPSAHRGGGVWVSGNPKMLDASSEHR